MAARTMDTDVAEAQARALATRLTRTISAGEPEGTVQLIAAGALIVATASGYMRGAMASGDDDAKAFLRTEITRLVFRLGQIAEGDIDPLPGMPL